jgi:hypothetical protein
MATKVYTTEEVELQDGTEVTLRPLPIKPLRKFMTKLSKLGQTEDGKPLGEDESLDQLFDLALVCLERNKATAHFDREQLEDILDLPTIYKVIEICGGVKLNDPKLLELASQMTQTD